MPLIVLKKCHIQKYSCICVSTFSNYIIFEVCDVNFFNKISKHGIQAM